MREALPNLGAEEGGVPADALAPSTPAGRLAGAFTSLVEDPPWPWLEAASGGVPWLVTPAAVDAARARGLSLWGPPPDVVRRVHDKAFAAEAARAVDPASSWTVVLHEEEATPRVIEAAVAAWPAWARAHFTVKPRWGTSGRGRMAGVDGRLSGDLDADRPLRAFVGRGGAVVEPWLARTLDLSTQWFISEEGDIAWLGTTRQVVRASGVYLGCDLLRAQDATSCISGTPWDDEAVARARVVVAAAAAAGYWGPCGVDAFVYATHDGLPVLRGIVELNARFTAGTVALGLASRAALVAGQRAEFRLARAPLLAAVE